MQNKETIKLLVKAKNAIEQVLYSQLGVDEESGQEQDQESESEESESGRGFSRSGGRTRGRVTDPEHDKRVKNKEKYEQ